MQLKECVGYKEFKNYKEFCSYYSLPVKTGQAKQNQMKYLSSIFDLEKVPNSQKIIVYKEHILSPTSSNVSSSNILGELVEQNMNNYEEMVQERVEKYVNWYHKRNKPYDLMNIKAKAKDEITQLISNQIAKEVKGKKLTEARKHRVTSYTKKTRNRKKVKSKKKVSIYNVFEGQFRKNSTFLPYTCGILNELMKDKDEFCIKTFTLYEHLGFHNPDAYSNDNINSILKIFKQELSTNSKEITLMEGNTLMEQAIILFNYYSRIFTIKKRSVLQSSITALEKRDIYKFKPTFYLTSEHTGNFITVHKDILAITNLKKETMKNVIGSSYYISYNQNDSFRPFFLDKINDYMSEKYAYSNFIDVNDAYIIKKGKNDCMSCTGDKARKIINENIYSSFIKTIENKYEKLLKKSSTSSQMEEWILYNSDKYIKLGKIYADRIITLSQY